MTPLDDLDELHSLHRAYESLCSLAGENETNSIFVADIISILNIQFGRIIRDFEMRHVKAPSGRSPNLNLVDD